MPFTHSPCWVKCSDDLVSPETIGEVYGSVNGVFTSTTMAGPGVAFDDGSAFDGAVDIRAASLIGDLHRREGKNRQDAYAVNVSEGSRRLDLVVCDGVGSRSAGGVGAAIVATAVATTASSAGIDPVRTAIDRVHSVARDQRMPPVELSTTLVWASFTIGRPYERWKGRLVQYGDGDARVLRVSDREWLPIVEDAPGATTEPESFALPEAVAPARVCEIYWEPGEVFALGTDGISPHLDSQTYVGYMLANQWSRVPNRWQFLSSLAFRTPGGGDDRTLIALWRHEGNGDVSQSGP